MKLKTACTAFAIAMTAWAVSPSLVVADEVVPTEQQQTLPIADQIAQLAEDIEAELYSPIELSERIDELVEKIDSMLDLEPANTDELIGQRKFVLDLRQRLQLPNDGSPNGTMLTQTFGNPSGGGSVGGGSVGGGAAGGGVAGGAGIGGSVGGFSTLAGLGGLGGIIGSTVANNNSGGIPASLPVLLNP